MPPFKDNGALSQNHKIFNYRHSSTRIVVEHAFGLLKGRFRKLQHLHHLDIKISVKCIMVSCILHNICLKYKDDTVIIMPNISDDLISNSICDLHTLNTCRSRREEVFGKMFS